MSEASAADMAGIAGGAVTLLASIGGGVKFLFGRAERREKALDAKEGDFVKRLEGRVAALEIENRKIWLVIGYVVPALHAHDPASPALKAAAQILGDAYPVDLSTPQDMTDTLKRMDQ
jgi:hypothetical protein